MNQFSLFLLFGYEDLQPKDSLGKAVNDIVKKEKLHLGIYGLSNSVGEDVLGVEIQKYLAEKVTWEELVEEVKTKWTESR